MHNKFTKFQENWLLALESGHFKKNKGSLCAVDKKNNLSYCCLGVACAVYNEMAKKNKKKKLVETLDRVDRYKTFNGEEEFLPKNIQKQLKLWEKGGAFKNLHYVGECQSLVDMNDNGYSHKRIAKWIRENPKRVFTNFDES